jgi:hypothetical protein
MTGSQLLLLGLVVIAAVVAGYFIGRWAADRDYGARAARPSPLPEPDEAIDETASEPVSRQRRGPPPPASAGGEGGEAAAPAPRSRASPPPASAGGDTTADASASAPRRTRRGAPPPAAAGVVGSDPDRET